MASERTRIVVAENNELFRKGLVALIKTYPKLEVVDEAAHGRELIECLKQRQVDLVIMDSRLPLMDSKTVLRIIQQRFPAVKTILLSADLNPQIQSEFIAEGASCILSKGCGARTLFEAIQKVRTDGFFFDSASSKAILQMIIKGKKRKPVQNEIHFSEREIEILKALCDGKTNKEIAVDMNLTLSTVDFYRTKIYSKTDCHSAVLLLKYALRNGLVVLT